MKKNILVCFSVHCVFQIHTVTQAQCDQDSQKPAPGVGSHLNRPSLHRPISLLTVVVNCAIMSQSSEMLGVHAGGSAGLYAGILCTFT